jgi:tRNA threonylcarbamoyladenosine biosynthesis protein TsaB
MWLALDTSTPFLALALVKNQGGAFETVAETAIGPHLKQSELLPGALHTFLEKAGLNPRALSGIVVGLGPGSFTGLRVGLACAKGLAYATQIPLTGVSSLAAIAAEAPHPGPLLAPLMLSRRGELYIGFYRRTESGIERVAEEEALSLAACAERLKSSPGILAIGPAVEAHREQLLALGVSANTLQIGPAHPSARCLVALANLPATYDFQKMAALEPHYIGTSGAERNAPQGV